MKLAATGILDALAEIGDKHFQVDMVCWVVDIFVKQHFRVDKVC